jgi:hypothetical protein
VEDFGHTDETFELTLDNASLDTNAMNIITPLFNSHAASLLLHQGCAFHIIDLTAKCALKILKMHIENV